MSCYVTVTIRMAHRCRLKKGGVHFITQVGTAKPLRGFCGPLAQPLEATNMEFSKKIEPRAIYFGIGSFIVFYLIFVVFGTLSGGQAMAALFIFQILI